MYITELQNSDHIPIHFDDCSALLFKTELGLQESLEPTIKKLKGLLTKNW